MNCPLLFYSTLRIYVKLILILSMLADSPMEPSWLTTYFMKRLLITHSIFLIVIGIRFWNVRFFFSYHFISVLMNIKLFSEYYYLFNRIHNDVLCITVIDYLHRFLCCSLGWISWEVLLVISKHYFSFVNLLPWHICFYSYLISSLIFIISFFILSFGLVCRSFSNLFCWIFIYITATLQF